MLKFTPKNRDEKIPENEILFITTGCYDTYKVIGIFRILKTFSTKSEIQIFIKDNTLNSEYPNEFAEEDFISYLIKKDLIKPIKSWNWHLRDYSSYEDACSEEFSILDLED